jgi:predicted Rossmann fold nucleotide-binding protein DprA/Smf involved in DNA uptake
VTAGETKSSKNSDEKLKLSGLELKLWNLLEGGEMGIDDLIGELDEDASSVLASLLSLELRHVVKQLPGKRVVRCR